MPILDSEEDNSSPASINSSTKSQEDHPSSGARTKHPSFEFDLEAQLLRDIENSGGIHSISLRRLCDLKPFLYGEKNSKERKRIQNKVNRWKQLKSKEYKQLLCNLLPERYPVTPTTPPRRPLPSTNQDQEDEEKESQEPSPAASRHIHFASPISTHQQIVSPISAAIMLTTVSSSMNKNVTYIQRILAANEYVEIEVDVNHPERNRELQVFHFFAKKHDGKLHNGFSIELNVDVRDFKAGFYQAFLLPDSQHVFLKFPGQPASFTEDFKIVSEREQVRDKFCDRIQESRDVSRNAIKKSEKRVTKHIVLKFPPYMTLSNVIYSPGMSDGEIKLVSLTYMQDVKLGGENYKSLMCRISWRLSLVEAADRTVDEKAEDKTYEDELVDDLKVCSVSVGGDSMAGSPGGKSRSGSVCGVVVLTTPGSSASASKDATKSINGSDTDSRGDTVAKCAFVENPGGSIMTSIAPANDTTRTLDMDEDSKTRSTPLPSPMSSVASTAGDEESRTVYDFLNSLRLMTPTFRNPRNHTESTIETTTAAGVLGGWDDEEHFDDKRQSGTEKE